MLVYCDEGMWLSVKARQTSLIERLKEVLKFLIGKKLTAELANKIAKQSAELVAASLKPDAMMSAEIQAKASVDAATIGKLARIKAAKIRTISSTASALSALIGVGIAYLYFRPIRDANERLILDKKEITKNFVGAQADAEANKQLVNYIENTTLKKVAKEEHDAYQRKKSEISVVTFFDRDRVLRELGLQDLIAEKTQKTEDIPVQKL